MSFSAVQPSTGASDRHSDTSGTWTAVVRLVLALNSQCTPDEQGSCAFFLVDLISSLDILDIYILCIYIYICIYVYILDSSIRACLKHRSNFDSGQIGLSVGNVSGASARWGSNLVTTRKCDDFR